MTKEYWSGARMVSACAVPVLEAYADKYAASDAP